jgi:2-amino-4-hydroxy-6-hydroxymethyldihydropteridine diphosphokinase
MDYIKKYEEIAGKLGLDMKRDLEAARILDGLSPKTDLGRLEKIIKNKNAFVFGAGPSLKEDIREMKKFHLDKSPNTVLIAADGAAKALMEERLQPNIQVTDLDGFDNIVIELNKKGVITVVHAHGSNMDSLKNVVPNLSDFYGTTQTKAFGGLLNFGGFTDGDRCVFLADKFKPHLIILAGMDFGKEVGFYSGRYNKVNKAAKLEIGKKLLEEYAKESSSTIVNMTSKGESLLNIPRLDAENLKNLID